MDPVSLTGLAIGVGSLAFDVFDGSIKREYLMSMVAPICSKTPPDNPTVFKFFSSMAGMPGESERCRLQLTIEYNRFLAWGEAVGLIGVPNDSDIASSLGTNAVELCSIIAHIRWLLEEFKDINDRWKDKAQSCHANDRTAREQENGKVDLCKEVSSLALAYEQNTEKHKHKRGSSRIIAWVSKGANNAKEIINHPSRARWAMVDKFAYEALLADLHQLIERIHELMSDYRGKQIFETTARTYREMVIVRNDLCELKNMIEAVTAMLSSSTNTSAINAHHQKNYETLRDLLQLKEIQFTSDEILSRMKNNAELDITEDLKDVINISKYDEVLFSHHFTETEAQKTISTLDPHRPRGVLFKEGKDYEVWIEWRTTAIVMDGSIEDKESMLRTATLAQMLSMKKPQHLFSPTCLGYVDNRKQNNKLGWIYEMPRGSNSGTLLKTLHGMLGHKEHMPSLSQRISIAWKLASSLLHLHATDWLHKGIHSGNVIFSCNEGKVDIESPILSGFEFSRPQSNKTTSRSPDPKWDIYRWPCVQNQAPSAENSRKTTRYL